MDLAYKDPKYKDARNIINSKSKVKLYIEDLTDYDKLFGSKGLTDFYKRPSTEQIISNLDELKTFCKYINRIGLSIVKVEQFIEDED